MDVEAVSLHPPVLDTALAQNSSVNKKSTNSQGTPVTRHWDAIIFHQAHSYLSSHRTSLPFDRYQTILLGDLCVKNFSRVIKRKWNGQELVKCKSKALTITPLLHHHYHHATHHIKPSGLVVFCFIDMVSAPHVQPTKQSLWFHILYCNRITWSSCNNWNNIPAN